MDPRVYHTCGVQSVHHAFLALGCAFSLGEMFKQTALGKMIFGQELECLQELVQRFGGRSKNLSGERWSRVRAGIDRALGAGAPVVLGSDPEEHWLLLVGKTDDGEYIWLDSADSSLTGTWNPDEAEEWVGEPNSGEIEALAIYPRSRPQIRRSMVPHFESVFELLGEDRRLASRWGDYLNDLDEVFNFETSRGPWLDSEHFFTTNVEPIVQPVLWTDYAQQMVEADVRDVFANYQTVANCHSLRLPSACESHCIAHMAFVLRDSVLGRKF